MQLDDFQKGVVLKFLLNDVDLMLFAVLHENEKSTRVLN